MFWKKRRDDHKAILRLEEMNENLKESFSRIRADIEAVKGWLEYFQTKQQENDTKFKDIQERIEEIGEVVSYIGEAPQIHAEILKEGQSNSSSPELEPKPPAFDKGRLVEGLTETQRSIFLRVGTLLQESGQQWISIKGLAHELYPDRPYDQVRSTLSEYLSILIESGLIQKKRVGKSTYITISDVGIDLLPEAAKKVLRKIVLKKKQKA